MRRIGDVMRPRARRIECGGAHSHTHKVLCAYSARSHTHKVLCAYSAHARIALIHAQTRCDSSTPPNRLLPPRRPGLHTPKRSAHSQHAPEVRSYPARAAHPPLRRASTRCVTSYRQVRQDRPHPTRLPGQMRRHTPMTHLGTDAGLDSTLRTNLQSSLTSNTISSNISTAHS